MIRTKLADRVLPSYSKSEEIFNMTSHIVGGGLGVVALVLCVIFSSNVVEVLTSILYGLSLIALYTMSSIYHGLRPNTGKKVMQIIDHCTIYFLIAGTYTPILLCKVMAVSPTTSWILFAFVWICAIVATTLTAIDLKKYSKFSMLCYIGMGWSAVFALNVVIEAISLVGFVFILAGGIAYSIGAITYQVGKKHTKMHSIFHLFCLLGSILQFICILFFVIL